MYMNNVNVVVVVVRQVELSKHVDEIQGTNVMLV